MKIWYQSASSYGFEPVWDEYGRTIEEQCATVINKDTQVHVRGIRKMVRDIENWRSLYYYQNVQILQNMQQAQAEGYDAFVIGCTLDYMLQEGKSMLDIPVVGISEASYHMAMTMGRMFAVVTASTAFNEVFGEMAERYGVASRLMPGRYIVPASEEEIAQALTHPDPLIAKFKATAARAVADGASVILPGPAFYATLAHRAGLHEVDGALVLDIISVAVKQAEMLVGLRKAHVAPSQRIGVYCKPDAALMKSSFDAFEEIFSVRPRRASD